MANVGAHIPVAVFTDEEALAFLTARTGRADADGARKLSSELGWLPLALAQASAVIKAQHLDYAVYLDRLRTMPVKKLLGPVEAGQYPHGLAAAVLLSLDGVQSADDAGICGAVMDLISVLSSAGIPRAFLQAAGNCAAFGIRAVPPDEVDDALARLAGSSLLTF